MRRADPGLVGAAGVRRASPSRRYAPSNGAVRGSIASGGMSGRPAGACEVGPGVRLGSAAGVGRRLRLAGDGVERDRALSAGERATPAALAMSVGLGGAPEQQRDESECVRVPVWRAGVLASVVARECHVDLIAYVYDDEPVGCGRGLTAQAAGEPVALAFG